ncbi:uncharacterized protein LOC134457083 [Engraulis encrasicolus]|uniref:uncharacterized protein LOC134457083 n=1 Tax=Engraulis encrasicolus TaxID=184585 RepID=UPI002FD556E9
MKLCELFCICLPVCSRASDGDTVPFNINVDTTKEEERVETAHPSGEQLRKEAQWQSKEKADSRRMEMEMDMGISEAQKGPESVLAQTDEHNRAGQKEECIKNGHIMIHGRMVRISDDSTDCSAATAAIRSLDNYYNGAQPAPSNTKVYAIKRKEKTERGRTSGKKQRKEAKRMKKEKADRKRMELEAVGAGPSAPISKAEAEAAYRAILYWCEGQRLDKERVWKQMKAWYERRGITPSAEVDKYFTMKRPSEEAVVTNDQPPAIHPEVDYRNVTQEERREFVSTLYNCRGGTLPNGMLDRFREALGNVGPLQRSMDFQ